MGLNQRSEWRVASGEWRVASGEWRVASGEWREILIKYLYRSSTLLSFSLLIITQNFSIYFLIDICANSFKYHNTVFFSPLSKLSLGTQPNSA